MGRWSNSVVFITGASAGIGEALARKLASEGATVAVGARRLERLESLVDSLTAGGAKALAIQCDVTEPEAMTNAVARIIGAYGRLDMVVANAGFGVAGSLLKLTNDDYQRQLETNVYGVMNTLRAAHPELQKSQGRAAIVGSVNSFVSLPGNSAYAMSKFAVRALAQSLWAEWRSEVSTRPDLPRFSLGIRQVNNQGVYRNMPKTQFQRGLSCQPAASQLVALYRRKRKSLSRITANSLFGSQDTRYISF